MNQTLLLVIAFCLISGTITCLQAQDCSCEDSFESTVEAYEKNYSLFVYKVRDDNRDLYTAHTDVMREKAKATDNLPDCKLVLEQWLSFFRDGHTYLRLTASGDPYFENIHLTEKQFKADYHKLGYSESEVSGIWKNGGYTVAIMPNPKKSIRKRDFVGVMLESTNENWKPTEVKFELLQTAEHEFQATFFMKDHSARWLSAKQAHAGRLEFRGLNDWQKIWPAVEVDENSRRFNEFHIRMIDDVPYVRFPDFFTRDFQYVDSLVNAHHEELMNAEFIVVDVRDNSGGSDRTYFPILPYLLTGPIQIPHVGFWMSEDNIQAIIDDSDIKGKKPEELSPEDKEQYDWLMSLKDSVYYDHPGVYAYTYEADTLYQGPHKVAVLMNENSVSSAETFIFRGKQSDKVVFYGRNSAGVVDGFMVKSKNIGCFEVSYPSAYRAGDLADHPIDPYGLEPDVYVNKKLDVLDFSIRHMKQLIKNEKTAN